MRVANVGNRPAPPDPRANLLLGAMGMGPSYYSVRAINGTDDELCVGIWDAVANRCSGTLPTSLYDPALGIEATSGVALSLPVRDPSDGRQQRVGIDHLLKRRRHP